MIPFLNELINYVLLMNAKKEKQERRYGTKVASIIRFMAFHLETEIINFFFALEKMETNERQDRTTINACTHTYTHTQQKTYIF